MNGTAATATAPPAPQIRGRGCEPLRAPGASDIDGPSIRRPCSFLRVRGHAEGPARLNGGLASTPREVSRPRTRAPCLSPRASPRARPVGRRDRGTEAPAFPRRRVRTTTCDRSDARARIHATRGLAAAIGGGLLFAISASLHLLDLLVLGADVAEDLQFGMRGSRIGPPLPALQGAEPRALLRGRCGPRIRPETADRASPHSRKRRGFGADGARRLTRRRTTRLAAGELQDAARP